MSAPDSSSAALPPDDPQHLSRLRSLIERVMADGKISAAEATELRAALIADGQVTPDEMDLIRTVMKKHLGDGHLEFE
ncbi:hypothetical protein [Leptolyngbya iicbica]|uniref:Uncharacterized protein n=2 Tax=Cyanophyceae TaxID=3028117 RepID=A0A4Q7E6T2_9CYAN|nr:hypothetical protein [Leptolyngbya sp. LK]RZM77749.1 hypothetical protein DYY88_14310 [Leptolyngbya sp. LK]